MKRILSPGQVKNCLKKWQAILRLQDWDIDVSVVPAAAFMQDGCSGECGTSPLHKSASIHLVIPRDYYLLGSKETPDYDMEMTLIHELVHVSLCEITENVPKLLVEQAVDSLTKALVTLRDEAENNSANHGATARPRKRS